MDGGWLWMVVGCGWWLLPVECGWWLVVERGWWLNVDGGWMWMSRKKSEKVKRRTLGRASTGLQHGWMRGGCGWMVTGVDADRW